MLKANFSIVAFHAQKNMSDIDWVDMDKPENDYRHTPMDNKLREFVRSGNAEMT